MNPATPFEVRCLICNTVARSFHYTETLPDGEKAGQETCRCGNIEADSLGVPGRGRVLQKQPGNFEIISKIPT